MLTCVRDMCHRMAYEVVAELVGGKGRPVAALQLPDAQCSAVHPITLLVREDNMIHMIHNHVPLQVHLNMRVFTDLPPADINCIVMGLDQCPISLANTLEEAFLSN